MGTPLFNKLYLDKYTLNYFNKQASFNKFLN